MTNYFDKIDLRKSLDEPFSYFLIHDKTFKKINANLYIQLNQSPFNNVTFRDS